MIKFPVPAEVFLDSSVAIAAVYPGTTNSKAAIDYCESWYEGSTEKIERAVHPDLAKRIVRTDPQSKNSRLDHMGAMRLYQNVRSGYGKKTPKEKQLKEATVLDVLGNAASVKAVMSDWIDYMHIAKINGRWVIVNVLWEMKPQPQPQQQ